MFNRLVATVLAAAAFGAARPAVSSERGYSLPFGATGVSGPVHGFNIILFWACAAIAVTVFSVIVYSIVRFRNSVGALPGKTAPHSTRAEVVWTLIPVVILVATVIPAARALIVPDNARGPAMSIMVTGYQWKWHYDYLGTGVSFYSTLAAPYNAPQLPPLASSMTPKDSLLDVDNPLVIPVDTNVRLLLTGNDARHLWSVPDVAVDKAAIPGSINEAWFKATRTGRYSGQCGELCGRDHAFMPIVVEVISKQAYAQWLAAKRAAAKAAASGAAVAVIATTAITPTAATIATPF